jgi:hypothetical protein
MVSDEERKSATRPFPPLPLPDYGRVACDSAGTQAGQTRIVSCDRLVSTTIYAIWGLPINELFTSSPCAR